MPSTFNSPVGKVIHKVKAELKQSLKLTKKAKAHFTFVSKSNMDGLQVRSSGSLSVTEAVEVKEPFNSLV